MVKIFTGFGRFILEIVVAYLVSIIFILIGIRVLQTLNMGGKMESVFVFLLIITLSILMPIIAISFINERFWDKSKNKRVSMLFALLGTCIPGVIVFFLPADKEFGILGGVAIVEYITAPALAAIGYNLGKWAFRLSENRKT
jgi:hypothetical protein